MTTRPILLVDDDVALLEAIPSALALRLPHVSVDTSASGLPVLEQVKAREYHAIICDFNLPGIDGLALMRAMKAVRPSTPILLMTGNIQDELIKKAAEAGAYDFIRKPVNRDLFILSIKRALEAHDLRGHMSDTILRIEGLPSSLSMGAFRDILTPYGHVRWLRLIRESDESGRDVTSGYVEFATALGTRCASEGLENMLLEGQRLTLCVSNDVLPRRVSKRLAQA